MKPNKGISVDGSSRGNPGPAGYRIVDIETNKEIANIKIGDSTNNISEFIGLVHAIDYAINNNYTEVYSDSNTAIAWVKNKKTNSTLSRNNKTEKSLDLLQRALSHLNKLPKDYMKIVNKWETKKWGESPADYGYK